MPKDDWLLLLIGVGYVLGVVLIGLSFIITK